MTVSVAYRMVAALACLAILYGCNRDELQGNGLDWRDQVWLSETSQLKIRAAQTRIFDTTDRLKLLQAVVSTMQDLDFKVDVLDQDLGVVSGKKFVEVETDYLGDRVSYYMYQPDTLLFLARSYRSWGPFYYRSNLVRFTGTIRPRGETQSLVRISVQYSMRALEDPKPYQEFFRTLEQSVFLQGHEES
ncbi:conserved exported protein of unknown function [Nitrospira sp. KM1]|uniref:hypothetical protein n=1 Tax=Nitrospira sp. KM1 TaxID=1936990 RepID=UPI0013A78422|nr:hypothetical protein [Nitrospira sp. KM1]BCA56408.1 conserved exported protein of unknown function [Nitrospira sp. KM1]